MHEANSIRVCTEGSNNSHSMYLADSLDSELSYLKGLIASSLTRCYSNSFARTAKIHISTTTTLCITHFEKSIDRMIQVVINRKESNASSFCPDAPDKLFFVPHKMCFVPDKKKCIS